MRVERHRAVEVLLGAVALALRETIQAVGHGGQGQRLEAPDVPLDADAADLPPRLQRAVGVAPLIRLAVGAEERLERIARGRAGRPDVDHLLRGRGPRGLRPGQEGGQEKQARRRGSPHAFSGLVRATNPMRSS